MIFAHPWLLLLLVIIPLIAWLRSRFGKEAAFVYSSVELVKPVTELRLSRPERILRFLRWVSLSLLIIALAQPRLSQGEKILKTSGLDIILVLDLSGSMAAEDFILDSVRVNRLVIAKDVLKRFVEERRSDRMGLVAFAGAAYLACPLTMDHDFLLRSIDRLELGMIEDRTAIGAGLTAGLNRLRDLNSKSKIVILMTDGQNNSGKVPPLTAATAAEALKIKVYTIGVGTRGNAPMPYVDSFGRKAYAMTPVDIDEKTLQEIADRTGGKYYRADSTETLRRIYKEIDQLEKTDAETRKFQQFREIYFWFALAGVVVFLLELLLRQTVWRKLP